MMIQNEKTLMMRFCLGKRIRQNGSSAHERRINKQGKDFIDNP